MSYVLPSQILKSEKLTYRPDLLARDHHRLQLWLVGVPSGFLVRMASNRNPKETHHVQNGGLVSNIHTLLQMNRRNE